MVIFIRNKANVSTGLPVIERYTAGDDFYNENSVEITYIFNITDNGGTNITDIGLCIDTTSSPITKYSMGYSSEGIITSLIVDGGYPSVDFLPTANKTYYVRPYATNANGTVYGDERIFICHGTGKYETAHKTLYATELIGSQLWTKFNLATAYSGGGASVTTYYPNNDESNEPNFGLFYDYYTSNLVIPTGWRLPTANDFITLGSTLGGDNIAGGKMKDINSDYWNNPNYSASNSSLFYARGAGFRSYANYYLGFKSNSQFWTSTDGNIIGTKVIYYCAYNSAKLYSADLNYTTSTYNAVSVRLIKN